LAEHCIKVEVPGKSRTTEGPKIREFYEGWILSLPTNLGIHLDEKRAFDDRDRSTIYARDEGKCQICRQAVGEFEVEIDHYPVAWTLGGRTNVENGRLVHARCHPRGRLGLHLTGDE
jgi:hypothetical protein